MENKIEPVNHHTKAIRVMQDHFGEQPIVGITIGTAEALLEKGLLSYLPNLTMIYAIDPYLFVQGGEFEAGINDQAWHDDRRNQAIRALAEYPNRYAHLCIGSDDAVDKTPDVVDFVWIDGGHSRDQITKDLKNYYPKVKSGGIFGGHDWDKAIYVVKENLKEDVAVGVDLTWWLVKQ